MIEKFKNKMGPSVSTLTDFPSQQNRLVLSRYNSHYTRAGESSLDCALCWTTHRMLLRAGIKSFQSQEISSISLLHWYWNLTKHCTCLMGHLLATIEDWPLRQRTIEKWWGLPCSDGAKWDLPRHHSLSLESLSQLFYICKRIIPIKNVDYLGLLWFLHVSLDSLLLNCLQYKKKKQSNINHMLQIECL